MGTRLRLALVGALMLAGMASSAWAQAYPDKPIRFVVPFPPGSTTDLVTRILAQELGKSLSQQVVAENRGGAGGNIGSEAVAKSPPDGYTLLMGTIGTHAINVGLYGKLLPYDPIADFAPVIAFAIAPNILVVNPSVPAKSVQELIAYAKANPGKLNFGSSGNGTSGHLSGEMLKAIAKVDAVHIPYKGGAQAITDLLGGQVSMMFYHYLPLLPHVQDGKLRPLAITSDTRSPALPDLPTMVESGLPGFDVRAWFAVYAPAKTPQPVIARLNGEINRILATEGFRKTLAGQGVDPMGGSPEDLTALMKAEIPKWAEVIKASGAKVD